MGLFLVRSSIAVDLYAPRAPNGSDLFVNFSAGSDGSGTEGSPYNTLNNTRVGALTAGQQLVVTGNGAWPNASGAADGTSANRIVVRAHPNNPGSGFTFTDNGARLGGGDYWDFYAIRLECDNFGLCLRETGDLNGGVASHFFRAIDCTGVRNSMTQTDNSGIIWANNGTEVGNDVCQIIRGQYTGPISGTQNESLLWFDYWQHVEIIGVLLDGTANPIYFKHTNFNSSGTQSFLIKNCIIRRAGRGFQAAANYVTYHNNAFDSCVLGMDESGGGDAAGGNNCTLTHNTFLNSDVSCAITDGGTRKRLNNTLTNNAFLGASRFLDNQLGVNSNEDQGNVSNYTACEGSSTNHYYRNNTQRTLAQHQSAFSGQEVNGVAGSIALVGGSTPGSTAANWAMSSGVGKNAASDGTDCGVDASKLLTVN